MLLSRNRIRSIQDVQKHATTVAPPLPHSFLRSNSQLKSPIIGQSTVVDYVMVAPVSVSRCAIAASVAASYMSAVVASYDAIAGYTPVSDVVPHSLLDLDVEEMEVAADLQTIAGFTTAYTAYSEGGNR